jgi:hypothetical protein
VDPGTFTRIAEWRALSGYHLWPDVSRYGLPMEQYAEHPMDLADASLIVAAEALRTREIFTIDRSDFATYRIRRGHRYYNVEIVG